MRTTINLNDKLYRSLKVRAAESDSSVSAIVEEAIMHQLLEDLEDIEDAKSRRNEPIESFDTLLKEFKAEGLL
jgi:predicted transcriptional regulator